MASRLDAIEGRCEEATDGPWRAGPNILIGGHAVFPSWANEEGPEVADFVGQNDATFIAHARSDVVDLVAVARATRNLVYYARLPESVARSPQGAGREELFRAANEAADALAPLLAEESS